MTSEQEEKIREQFEEGVDYALNGAFSHVVFLFDIDYQSYLFQEPVAMEKDPKKAVKRLTTTTRKELITVDLSEDVEPQIKKGLKLYKKKAKV